MFVPDGTKAVRSEAYAGASVRLANRRVAGMGPSSPHVSLTHDEHYGVENSTRMEPEKER